MRKMLLLFAVGVVVGALLPREGKRKAQPTVDAEPSGTSELMEVKVERPLEMEQTP